MAAPYGNTRSKITRAVVAYLVSLNNATIGDATDVLAYYSASDKTYPNTVVRAVRSMPQPNYTGSRRVSLYIVIREKATTDPQPANVEAQRVLFDARVAATQDALLQTSDNETLGATAFLINQAGRALQSGPDAANNADMLDFTCQQWIDMGDGEGTPDEEGNAWEEILMFDAVCADANVD